MITKSSSTTLAHIPWLPDGRLFVAGGTTAYINGNALGSKFVGIWGPTQANVPPYYGWDASLMRGLEGDPLFPAKPMHVRRWYPTVTLLSDNLVMVAGGTEDTTLSYCFAPTPADNAPNTYEVWDIQANDWVRSGPGQLPILYNGPSGSQQSTNPCYVGHLGLYSRQHLVSTNRIVTVGEWAPVTSVRHNPATSLQVWSAAVSNGGYRGYGSSVLLPNVGNTPGGDDLILILAGLYTSGLVLRTSQIINAGVQPVAVSPESYMTTPRMVQNAVLLPSGSVAVFGGSEDDYYASGVGSAPVLRPEVYDKVYGWNEDEPQVSPRMYHSTAVLHPSGKVISAGGDFRSSDYEIYRPAYMRSGQTQPVFNGGDWALPGTKNLGWSTDYVIDYAPLPPGVTIRGVVLMRPGSTTHHNDFDQRYLELQDVSTGEGTPNQITVRTPPPPNYLSATGLPGAVKAVHGFYMAFLVTSQGRPSQAKWVRFQ